MGTKAVALAGAGGFVGSAIADAIRADGRYRLIPVQRGDDFKTLFREAEIVVHAANPARRFQAEQDPVRDFHETVEKTAAFVEASRGRKFVLVSSFSCRMQLHLSYGRHRRACELLAASVDAVIVRLGPMFGGNRTRDTLHDILHGRPVYVAAETRYAYVDVTWPARRIVDLLEGPGGLREIGARNAIALSEIRDHFDSASTFAGGDDTQVPDGVADGPDAREVLAYGAKELAKASTASVE